MPESLYLTDLAEVPGSGVELITGREYLDIERTDDPIWSDFGSGYGLVTGRISALTAAGGAVAGPVPEAELPAVAGPARPEPALWYEAEPRPTTWAAM
jgi:hypothetical protein